MNNDDLGFLIAVLAYLGFFGIISLFNYVYDKVKARKARRVSKAKVKMKIMVNLDQVDSSRN